jgi:hypothetical protein
MEQCCDDIQTLPKPHFPYPLGHEPCIFFSVPPDVSEFSPAFLSYKEGKPGTQGCSTKDSFWKNSEVWCVNDVEDCAFFTPVGPCEFTGHRLADTRRLALEKLCVLFFHARFSYECKFYSLRSRSSSIEIFVWLVEMPPKFPPGTPHCLAEMVGALYCYDKAHLLIHPRARH